MHISPPLTLLLSNSCLCILPCFQGWATFYFTLCFTSDFLHYQGETRISSYLLPTTFFRHIPSLIFSISNTKYNCSKFLSAFILFVLSSALKMDCELEFMCLLNSTYFFTCHTYFIAYAGLCMLDYVCDFVHFFYI